MDRSREGSIKQKVRPSDRRGRGAEISCPFGFECRSRKVRIVPGRAEDDDSPGNVYREVRGSKGIPWTGPG